MRRPLSILALLLALIGFCVWWFSPTQVLKRRTKDLLGILSLDAGTPPASRTIGSFQLDRLLQPTVEFQVPAITDANGSFDRVEISSAFTWLCNNAKETRFKIEDLQSITINGDHATVVARLEARILLSQSQPVDGPGNATLLWKKADDGWRLERVSWQEAP